MTRLAAQRRTLFTPGRLADAALFVLAFIAVACVARGVWLGWQHVQGADPSRYRAGCAVLLAVLGLCQGVWLARLLRRRPATDRLRLLVQPVVWRSTLVVAVVAYGLTLVLGPDPAACDAWLVVLAGWHTSLVAALAGCWRPQTSSGYLRHGAVRRLEWMLFAAAALPVGAEAALRAHAWCTDQRLSEACAARRTTLLPGSSHKESTINSLGYWGREFTRQRGSGTFRVAVLGDAVTLSGTSRTNLLVRIEDDLPGIEIYNFGLIEGGPREYVTQFLHEVQHFEPDLVLCFITVGNDITDEAPLPGWFDWRSLRLCRWAVSAPSAPAMGSRVEQLDDAQARAAFLAESAAELAVCRTPIDEPLRTRWREVFSHLGDLDLRCRRRDLPLALVIVPAPFQLNSALRATLCRRAGLDPQQLDPELPQRRLLAFAHERGLPACDLLPHLRESGPGAHERSRRLLSEEGNRAAARALGGWLQSQFGGQMSALARTTPP